MHEGLRRFPQSHFWLIQLNQSTTLNFKLQGSGHLAHDLLSEVKSLSRESDLCCEAAENERLHFLNV